MVTDTGADIGNALRVVIPVIYILIAIISIIGNGIALQLICASRMVHRSIHLLLCSIIIEDICFTIIFLVIRAVSYSYLTATWFLNPEYWCKAEMYLLRIFDFVLAYTIVALCFDRLCASFASCACLRRLLTGFWIVIGIWVSSAYVLIPILFFRQKLSIQSYGGYLCYTTDESAPLTWLNEKPRRTLDFIDFLFRIVFPLSLMILFQLIIFFQKILRFGKREPTYDALMASKVRSPSEFLQNNTNFLKLRFMVLCYVIIFAICEMPYELYRGILVWHEALEFKLRQNRLDYAIEIPLLLLKLINRAINPFLIMCLGDKERTRNRCCRLWCLPCLPFCIGCDECWCTDIANSIINELKKLCKRKKPNNKWVPTGYQTINTTQYLEGNQLVIKKIIREEYQTGVEPYYKLPRINSVDPDNWTTFTSNQIENPITLQPFDYNRQQQPRVPQIPRKDDNQTLTQRIKT